MWLAMLEKGKKDTRKNRTKRFVKEKLRAARRKKESLHNHLKI